MKVKTVQTVSNLQSWEELRRFVSIQTQDILDAINGRLSIIENCQTKLVSVKFSAVNTTLEVSHGLGFIPNGYILAGSDAACILYDGNQPANTSSIFLKSSAVCTARVLFF